ncbi:hypothetical protein ACY1LM_01370 [Klebsiella pneumoniae]
MCRFIRPLNPAHSISTISHLVDVTDEVNISANAGVISGLTTRVTNAEGKATSQGNSITSLQNSLTRRTATSVKTDAEALQNLKNTVTQQGKDISTQSSNITSLQNGLNTANAGIDSLVADNDASKRFVGNLLANPSFERGLTGYSGGGAFITVIDAQSPNTGSRILSCGTGTGAALSPWMSQNIAPIKSVFLPAVRLVPFSTPRVIINCVLVAAACCMNCSSGLPAHHGLS